MSKLHPRELATIKAESAVTRAIYGTLAKHDLTDGEALRVIVAAFGSVLGGMAKAEIRQERHGRKDKPGGLA